MRNDYEYIEEDVVDESQEEPRDLRGRLRGDENLVVKFYKRFKKDEAATAAAGRPISTPFDFLIIQIPGDKTYTYDNYVFERDIKRFPVEWAKYQSKMDRTEAGTPIEQYPKINTKLVAELKALSINTVEALAGLSDALAAKYFGFSDLKRDAGEWLAATEANAVANNTAEVAARQAKAELENNQMQAEIKLMKEMLAEQAAEIAAAKAAKKGSDKEAK